MTLQKHITDRSTLEHLRDVVTNLPNQLFLNSELHRIITKSQRYANQFGVLLISFDNFNNVGAKLAADMGDQAVQMIAKRLRSVLRASDFVSYLSDDKFVVLIGEMDSVNSINRVVDKLLHEFENPVTINACDVHTSLSIGISLFPHDGNEADSLLLYADKALSHARMEGGNGVHFYQFELTEKRRQRTLLENELRQAIEKQQFEVYYQPVVPTTSSIAFRAEALVRWRHPTKGMILPKEFLSLAEESGLIVPIGGWVIHKACQDAAKWPNINGKKICLSINASSRQLKFNNLLDTVKNALKESKLAPQRLCIEITQQSLVDDMGNNLQVIGGLRKLGVEIAIEDFGIGVSSFAYIRDFHPQKIKVDKTLVHSIGESPQADNLVSAIISMGTNLDMSVIAEGVETEEQRNHLVKKGCKYIQGYLYAQPMPYNAFINWLSQRHAAVQSIH